MQSKKEKKEFGRYSLVGFFATLIDYVLLNLLTHVIGLPFIVSNIVSASVSSAFSYVLNRKVVFKDKAHSEHRTILLFVGLLVIGIVVIQSVILFILGNGLVEGLLVKIGIGKGMMNDILALNIAKIIAGLATYVWNFFTQRRFVFESHDESNN